MHHHGAGRGHGARERLSGMQALCRLADVPDRKRRQARTTSPSSAPRIAERTMDERMRTTPWFHATDIPNAPATNLVQIGIGGWIGNRPGIKVAQERDTTVISMYDVEEIRVEGAIETALECAWKDADAVFLSFDIDCVDPGFAPGTGTPSPVGCCPGRRSRASEWWPARGSAASRWWRSPPSTTTPTSPPSSGRAIMDVLGTLVEEGHRGSRPTRAEREGSQAEATEANRREVGEG